MGPVMASAGPTAVWYLTRASGMVALVLLTASLVLGILTTRGWTSARWPRFVSQAMHRNVSLFSLLFIAIHIVTAVADGFAPIGYLDSVLPFRSPYRSLWLGLGALSFDLLIVVGLTTAIRHRIGYRTWRSIHWLGYASWPVAVLHGIGTGTDSALAPVLLIDAACLAAVLAALTWRLAAGWPAQAGTRVAAGTAAGAFAISVIAFTAVGPLKPGWAQRAGTPASLLASAGKASAPPTPTGDSAVTPPATTPPAAAPSSAAGGGGPTRPFSASLSGALTTSSADGGNRVTVDIRGQLSGDVNLPFEITLVGTPDGGGVAMSSGQVTVGSERGAVVGLEGSRIVADLTSVEVTFRVGISGSSVTGTATGVPLGSGR